MALIQFTRNHQDQSTDNGYQFEFYCDRCGNGYQTRFEASAAGTVTSALDAASSLFGGMFGSVSNAAHSVRSAAWQKAHDDAFNRAVQEAQPHFHKCKRCGHWVDDDCWNGERGLCKDCAPDLQEEFSSIQTEAAIQDARMKAAQVEYVTADKFKQTIVGSCPHCGEKVSGGKFCPSCGKPLAATKFCTNCGATLQAEAKFCGECGTKQE
ncbi:MAG TPA: zinc ribbon domain-containing protein [Anaerolineales bacterium]|nr:zinc ribbon domain-containing protein [Anaerolineales bacterium]